MSAEITRRLIVMSENMAKFVEANNLLISANEKMFDFLVNENKQLRQRIEALEENIRHQEERQHQENLDRMDRDDSQWYRETNGLG